MLGKMSCRVGCDREIVLASFQPGSSCSGRGAAMIIESLRLFYHLRCFQCCVCHVQLGNGTAGTDVRVRNNKLHCQNCYSNDEGEKGSCCYLAAAGARALPLVLIYQAWATTRSFSIATVASSLSKGHTTFLRLNCRNCAKPYHQSQHDTRWVG